MCSYFIITVHCFVIIPNCNVVIIFFNWKSFVKTFLGSPTGADTESIKAENEALKKKNEELAAKVHELTEQLEALRASQ